MVRVMLLMEILMVRTIERLDVFMSAKTSGVFIGGRRNESRKICCQP